MATVYRCAQPSCPHTYKLQGHPDAIKLRAPGWARRLGWAISARATWCPDHNTPAKRRTTA